MSNARIMAKRRKKNDVRIMAKRRKKLVIFDCNGVLRTFSWPGVFQAYKEICKYFEIYFPSVFGAEDNLENFKYCHTHNLKHDFFSVGLDGKEFAKVNEIFHRVYDPHVKIFPWVEPALQELAKYAAIAVLSNSLTSSLEQTFNGAGRHISMLVGSDQTSKDDAEGIKKIIKKFGVAPEDVRMVGDTASDVRSGKEANIGEVLVVSWGATQTKGDLLDLEADRIFYQPQELMQFLRE